MTSTSRTGN